MGRFDPYTQLRYMVSNYLATSFEGTLLENPPEGELLWVNKDDALKLPMQSWFARRFPLFFQEGTFELSYVWDEKVRETLDKTERYYTLAPAQQR